MHRSTLILLSFAFASMTSVTGCGDDGGTYSRSPLPGAGAGSGGATDASSTNGSDLGGTRTSDNGTTSSSGGKASGGGSSTAFGSGGAGAGAPSNTGGASNGGNTSTYRPCPADGTVCKIMPFGDSVTDGFNWNTPGGYRVELFRLAREAGKNITFVGSGWNGPEVVAGEPFPHNHEGHSGWTIAPAGGRSGISTLVDTVMPKYQPHIVLLMVGTNDAIDDYDMPNAPTRLGELIDSIYAQLPEVFILVAQPIPSRGDSTKGDDTELSARIASFNASVPAVVKARADQGRHILVVDMFTPFDANKASLLADQWHPNLAGYVLIGSHWYSALHPYL